MSDTTPRLGLPYLAASQAQKHVTVNEALTLLDLLTGVIPALSRSLSSPPGGAVDGAVYILAGAGSGAWAGYAAGDIAMMIDGDWRRASPSVGMIASVAAESGKLIYWTGTAWAEVNPAAGSGTFTGLLTVDGRITFPATQNPSADPNTLDDYEEGTWTPTFSFGGASVGMTYTTQTGYYTKIGRLVQVYGYIRLSAKGSSTGNCFVGGWPFTISSALAMACPYYLNMGAGVAGMLSLFYSGGVVYLQQGAASGGGNTVGLTNSDFTDTSRITFSGVYQV